LGGGQEKGVRAGTENVAFLVGLGVACRLASEELPESAARLQLLCDRLHQKLSEYLPGIVHLNGHPTERLPNTLNVSLDGVIGEEVLASTPGIAASTGSACNAGSTDPSAVLTAMGIEWARALDAWALVNQRGSRAGGDTGGSDRSDHACIGKLLELRRGRREQTRCFSVVSSFT